MINFSLLDMQSHGGDAASEENKGHSLSTVTTYQLSHGHPTVDCQVREQLFNMDLDSLLEIQGCTSSALNPSRFLKMQKIRIFRNAFKTIQHAYT